MTKVLDILSKNKQKGIKITLDSKEQNISIKGDLSLLSVLDKEELKVNKDHIITFFKNQKNATLSIPKRQIGVSEKITLSPNQKSIWVQSKIEEDFSLYAIPALYEFHLPSFNYEVFKNAITTLVEEHIVLTYVFKEDKNDIYQEVSKVNIDNHVSFHNLTHQVEKEQSDEVENKTQVILSQGFDVEQTPPWSINVFDLGNDNFKFFLCVHHLIADGATLQIIINEIFKIYTLKLEGSSYKNKDIQYHDYIAWLNNRNKFENDAIFWKNYLAKYEDDVELTAVEIPEKDQKSSLYENIINAEIKEKIDAFCLHEKVALTHLFTLAYGIVLSKHTRSHDLIIGIPSESRSHPQLANVIGDLVNVLPFRLELDYTATITAQLKSVATNFVGILEHQIYPFEYILEDIDYKRKGNGFPLFNTMMSFPNNQENGDKNEDEIAYSKEKSLYDLTCSVVQYKNQIVLQYEFNSSKFTQNFIANFSDQLNTVLAQLIESPSLNLKEVSLLNVQEQEIMRKLGDSQPKVVVNYGSPIEVIESNVQRYPTQIALICGGKKWSYDHLFQDSIKVANKLFAKGIKKGDRIVVQLPLSEKSVSSILGIWMSGGIYVPLSADIPEGRKNEIIEDCNPIEIIDEVFFNDISDYKLSDHIEPLAENDDAYILYTSGSTGKPKGVLVTHGAIINKLIEETELLQLSDKVTTLTLTNPSFDVSFLELVLPLMKGGKVVVSSLKEIPFVANEIIANQVSILQGTPTFFSHFVSELNDEISKKINDNLEVLCIGGESLNDVLVRKLKEKLPSVKINNHYGPTEITIDAVVKEDVDDFTQNIIGQPIGNTQTYIVDDWFNILPEQIVGELIVCGPSLAKGYWNSEKLTNEKFVDIPRLNKTGYKTGDLVNWTKGGEIRFVGRKDNQIKFRGYRIELEEITSKIKEVNSISDAYTSVIGNSIVTWVVGENINIESLLLQLNEKLPAYMIPTAVEVLEKLPITANGKINKKELPLPTGLKQEYVAPRNELEEKLVEIWEEVLGREKIGVKDNFFDLGGHSLKAIRLVSLVSKELSIKLNLKDVFTSPVLEEQSTLLTKTNQTTYFEIDQLPEAVSYSISDAQRRLWVLSQFEGGSIAYNMPSHIILDREINIGSFKRSIHSVINRHEILRTVFKEDESGEPRQWILSVDELKFEIDYIDLRSSDTKEEKLKTYIFNDSYKVFDLENGPLLRASLLQLDEEQYVFYFNMYHIISDGWSMEVLAKDVLSYYESYKVNKEPNLSPLRIQYKDYSDWQLGQLETALFKDHKDYWLEKLSGELPILELPTTKIRPLLKTNKGYSLGTYLSKEISQKLKSYSQQNGGSLFIGLVASLNALFYRYTAEEDFIIGSPVAGRDHVDLEDQIGFYVNTLILRNEVKGEENFD
jgi:amino acid adenylation domain-containing protein